MKPKMPGMPKMMPVAVVVGRRIVVVFRSTLASAGIIGKQILCDTVTTGKCLIGLICGSISKLTAKRITYVTQNQSNPRTALTTTTARFSPRRKRNHSLAMYSICSIPSRNARDRSMIMWTSPGTKSMLNHIQ